VNNLLRFFLCASLLAATPIYATDTLRFIGDINFPTGEKFQDTIIGGLSGITYDKDQKKFLAVSDDKSQVNEARFYEFDFTLTDKTFSVKPASVVKLKNANNAYFKKNDTDFEGITLYGNDVLISSEGAINAGKSPEFYRFSRTGEFKDLLPVPDKFLLPKKYRADAPYGSRDNLSFEALSTALDGSVTYLGSEDALLQDGPTATSTDNSFTRIIIYKGLKPSMEIAYQLEKVETPTVLNVTAGMNGLVDIAAIDDKNFFTMERSYLPLKNKNIIRIFRCTITDKTTDISPMDSIKKATYKAVDKVLVADLDSFIANMNPHNLDNIEGITFGPSLPNGNQTLIVVSDNNFSPTQRTLFMAFELITKK
jgi:hypothetical protein